MESSHRSLIISPYIISGKKNRVALLFGHCHVKNDLYVFPDIKTLRVDFGAMKRIQMLCAGFFEAMKHLSHQLCCCHLSCQWRELYMPIVAQSACLRHGLALVALLCNTQSWSTSKEMCSWHRKDG
mmetsp:Transcript_9552/g.13805  ORF Transcript_9552/g.13805 Transcript_9552/m.13805 type:complete len:126 (+) Transcript_9552:532-909(+)